MDRIAVALPLHAALWTEFEDLVAETMAVSEQEHALLLKIRGRQRLLPGQWVCCRQQGDKGFAVDCLGSYAGFLIRFRYDDEIQLAVLEFLRQDSCEILLDCELHFWRLFRDFGDDIGKEVGANSINRADTQRTFELISAMFAELLYLAGFLQYALRLGNDEITRRGDGNLAFTALENGQFELLLELAHSNTQRRLTDEAGLCGPAEVPLPGNCDDIAQLCERHNL